MRYFHIVIDVSGISVPVDGDTPAVGFIAHRRVKAPDDDAAIEIIDSTFLDEPDVQSALGDSDRSQVSAAVQEMYELGWFGFYFTRCPSGFAFYQS